MPERNDSLSAVISLFPFSPAPVSGGRLPAGTWQQPAGWRPPLCGLPSALPSESLSVLFSSLSPLPSAAALPPSAALPPFSAVFPFLSALSEAPAAVGTLLSIRCPAVFPFFPHTAAAPRPASGNAPPTFPVSPVPASAFPPPVHGTDNPFP